MAKNKYILVVFAVLAIGAGIWWGTAQRTQKLASDGSGNNSPSPTPQAPATATPASSVNTTGLPLSVPAGFSLEIFAQNLPGARVMVQDSFGNVWVSQTSEGFITQLEVQDGKVVRQHAVFRNLRRPHGLAIDDNVLYFAEEHKISKVTLYSDDAPTKIADLPSGRGHFTRTLGFGPDGRLYVSIGSSCNVCNEDDERRAAIYSMNKDGSDFKLYAKGLRNSVFFAWSEVDGKMWATEMGRDQLGDNLPPEEINIVESGKDYGWPTCYGQNIHDTNFDKNTYIQNPCNGKVPPRVELPAHSAPLGIAFIPESTVWPEDYWHDLLVAYHGSWNRSSPTGYKVVRVKLDAEGNNQGIEDFISGWLPIGATNGPRQALGRPVGIAVRPEGIVYITDDEKGVVYKLLKKTN